jgi:hypothetical protein
MLQVIALASIATVVLTAAMFALTAATHESAGRAAQPEPDWFISVPPRSTAVARQPASQTPTVNLNIMVPLCVSTNEPNAPDVLAGTAVVSRPIRSGEGDATAVPSLGYRRTAGGVAGALVPAAVQPRAALDVSA